MFKSLKKLILLLGGMIIISPWLCFGAASRSFNGSSDYITLANESNFDFERTQPFSVCSHIKVSGTGIQTIASKLGAAGTTGWEVILYDGGSNQDAVHVFINSNYATSAIDVLTPQNSILTNTWYDVCMTYSGNSLASGVKVYINGVSQSLTVVVDNLTTSTLNNLPALVGVRDSSSPNFFFNGLMSYISIYSKELTSSEVAQLMYKPGSIVNGFVGYWPLWGSNSPEVDLSGNGNTGTLTGTTASSDGPPISLQGAIN